MKIWVVTQYESRKDPAVVVGVFSTKRSADQVREQVPNWRSVSSYDVYKNREDWERAFPDRAR